MFELITNYNMNDIVQELTRITEFQFHFLCNYRDYTDAYSHAKKHFDEYLFDEFVFNYSIQ